MKARKNFIVVAYDIVDNRNRNQVAKIMEKHGTRVNDSVFECMLTDSSAKKLQGQLQKWMDEDTDSIIFYPICVNCYSKISYFPHRKELVEVVKMV